MYTNGRDYASEQYRLVLSKASESAFTTWEKFHNEVFGKSLAEKKNKEAESPKSPIIRNSLIAYYALKFRDRVTEIPILEIVYENAIPELKKVGELTAQHEKTIERFAKTNISDRVRNLHHAFLNAQLSHQLYEADEDEAIEIFRLIAQDYTNEELLIWELTYEGSKRRIIECDFEKSDREKMRILKPINIELYQAISNRRLNPNEAEQYWEDIQKVQKSRIEECDGFMRSFSNYYPLFLSSFSAFNISAPPPLVCLVCREGFTQRESPTAACRVPSSSLEMMIPLLAALVVVSSAFDMKSPENMVMPSGDFVDLISRDAENLPEPVAFGHKFISGGAGEGSQKLKEEEDFQQRQEIKSDNVLPAYCEPPNPCPVGYTAEQGCLEEFDNTAEFSRDYQAQQHCVCDQEHMFNCAEKEASDVGQTLQDILDENGLHHNMIAKKFHEKRSSEELSPRKKRSVPTFEGHHKPNPFLQGEPLRTMQKKSGRNVW
ncbi:hypothetical protein WR25_09135 isoform B [Diploscapter pachys]|nr:hypothetical protein WR25_09135 isoform B [Diploscapter pachys]